MVASAKKRKENLTVVNDVDSGLVVDDRVEMVDASLANAYLVFNNFPGQRPLRNYHVRRICGWINRGEFRPKTEIHFVHILDSNQIYLINGQHTLTAISMCTEPELLSIRLYEVQSLEDARRLYSTFDRHLSRTHTDSMACFDAATKLDLIGDEVNAVSSAMLLIGTGFLRANVIDSPAATALRDSSVRFRLMEDWESEIRGLVTDIRGSQMVLKRKLLRHAVVAPALVMYRYKSEKASEFWHGLAMNDGIRGRDPRQALINFLLSTSTRKKGMDSLLYAKTVAGGWNMFFRGRELSHLKAQGSGHFINIEGTPHSRDRAVLYINPDGTVSHEGNIREAITKSTTHG